MEGEWYEVVSYRKGMIGYYSEKLRQRAGGQSGVKVAEVARLYLLKYLLTRRQPRMRSGVALILLVAEAVSELFV